MTATRRWRWPTIAAGLMLIALSRLPQLLDAGVVLDGDEAIVGLMAEHLHRRGELPVFFWGQSYGLATFEAAFGALAFAMFGASAVSLKIATLALWSLGWAFFASALFRLTTPRLALFGALLMILCPAWSEWAMMARGGYVTAFVTSSAALLLFAQLQQRSGRATLTMAGLGLLTALTYLAQPLWILALAPFLGLLGWQSRRRVAEGVVLAAAAVVVYLAVRSLAGSGEDYWAPLLFSNADVGTAAQRLPGNLLGFWEGSSFFNRPAPSLRPMTRLASIAWCGLMLLALVLGAVAAARRRGPLSVAATVGVVLVIGFTMAVDPQRFGYRYLLPVAAAVVLTLATTPTLASSDKRRPLAWIVAVIAAISAAGLYQVRDGARFGRLSQQRAAAVGEQALVDDLLGAGIHHVYSLDPMLQWSLMFTSGERILARWIDAADRYPSYPRAVDRALRSGERVALLGPANAIHSIAQSITPAPRVIDAGPIAWLGTVAWFAAPTSTQLRQLGFRLNP